MGNIGYVSLTRQSGLLREMQVVANNIANLSTTGFRREGVVFSEYIKGAGAGNASISFARAGAHHTDYAPGGLSKTGGSFDLAIEGDGFFLVATPGGERLTRAGAFTPNQEGELVAPDGARVLDIGGSPIFIPVNAGSISVSGDGVVSADGQALAQIGVMMPEDGSTMTRHADQRFSSSGPLVPAEGATVFQGFLEKSNVEPVVELARMIEVQRSYELGQKFLEREDDRIRSALRTLGK